jgi:hypothetical protein
MTDLLLDDTGDLSLSGNDFVFGLSDQQHQELLLLTEKGEWKESPLVGVGAMKFLESESTADLLREIRLQFSNDGMNVNAISITTTGQINIDATYPS